MGLVIDSKYFKGSHNSINSTYIKQTLVRLFLSFFLIVPFFVSPTFYIKSSRHATIVLIIKYAVPSFLISFIFYGYSKYIY